MKSLMVLLSILNFHIHFSQDVILKIENINTTHGVIRLAIYDSEENYNTDNPLQLKTIEKTNVKDKSITLNLDLPKGVYAIKVLDDINKNTKMDYNLVGIPKEGYGFSNYYHSGVALPKFNELSFSVKPNQKNLVLVKLKYWL